MAWVRELLMEAGLAKRGSTFGSVGRVVMFGSRQNGTVIAKGLKIAGSVMAEGLVEVDGEVEGEIRCTSLVISRGAQVASTVVAERVTVDGLVEGPIQGSEVTLKSHARVVGDMHHRSLSIEKGAFFDGRSVQMGATQKARSQESLSRSGSRVEPVEGG